MNIRAITAIFKRNLFAYFGSPTGYVFICAFVLASGFAAFWPREFFNANLANLDQLNKYIHFILLGFIPAITMSIWADERRQGTDELLLTLPASDLQVVIGKYFAAVAIFTVSLIFSLTNIIVLEWLGDPDIGLMFSTYLGYWFMGLAMLGVGMVASFLTGNLTVAFVLGAALNAPLVMAGHTDILGTSGSFAESMQAWSLHTHFNDFARGIVSLSSIVYFGAIVGMMLYLCSVLISRRHWSGSSSSIPLGVHYAVRMASIVVAGISLGWMAGASGARSDLTSEKLSVLSPKSVELIETIPESQVITIEVFISPEREIPELYVQTRINLLNMLDELEKRSKGRIKVKRHLEVESFKPVAVAAEERYGITEQRIFTRNRGRLQDSRFFMGLAFVGGENKQVVVPFLHRGIPVEYELMRSIVSLLDQEKKTLGIVMDADNRGVLMGGFNMQARRQMPTHPLISELRKQYNVKAVDPSQPMPQYELRDLTVNSADLPSDDRARAEAEVINWLRKNVLDGLDAVPNADEGSWAKWKSSLESLQAEAAKLEADAKQGQTNSVKRATEVTNQIKGFEAQLRDAFASMSGSTATSTPGGIFQLARMHEFGWGTEVNATAANNLYEEAGDALATGLPGADGRLKLAAAFDSGLLVRANPSVAEKWYRLAVQDLNATASSGKSDAMIKIADLLRANRGIPADLQAAMQGQENLAIPLLENGWDARLVEVARWYRKAADSGNPVGAWRLAELYSGGNGIQRDYLMVSKWRTQATSLLAKRAEQGNADAMHDLGVAHQRGHGVIASSVEAAKWFRKSLEARQENAESGDADAQYVLGKMLQFGPGPEHDLTSAAEWYAKAAEQGHAGAQYKLGQMHAIGDNGETDFEEAFAWYSKAAEQGNLPAMWALADLYWRGKGVKTDKVAAVKWNEIANSLFDHEQLLNVESRLEVAGRKGKVLFKNYDALLSFQPSSLSPGSMTNLVSALRTGAPTAVLEDPFVALYDQRQVPSTGTPKMGPPGQMGMPPRPMPKADINQLWGLLQVNSLSEANRTANDRLQIEEEMWTLASGSMPDARAQREELGLFIQRSGALFRDIMGNAQRRIQARIRIEEIERATMAEESDRRVSRDEISLWALEIQAELLVTAIKSLQDSDPRCQIYEHALKLMQPLLTAQRLTVEQASARRKTGRLGERAQRTRDTHIIWHAYNPFPKNDYLDNEIVFAGASAGGKEPAFEKEHEVSEGIQYMLFPFTGSLESEANATLQFEPLVRTGPASGLTRGSTMTGAGGGLSATRERVSTTDVQHILAAKIHGVPRAGNLDIRTTATDLVGRLGYKIELFNRQARMLRELSKVDPSAARALLEWLDGAFDPAKISEGKLERQLADMQKMEQQILAALATVDPVRSKDFAELLDDSGETIVKAVDLESVATLLKAEAMLSASGMLEKEAARAEFDAWNNEQFWSQIDEKTGKLRGPEGNSTSPPDIQAILSGLAEAADKAPAGPVRDWASRALKPSRFEAIAGRRIIAELREMFSGSTVQLRELNNEMKTILGATPDELDANISAMRDTAASLSTLLAQHGNSVQLALARSKRAETAGGSNTPEPATGPLTPWAADFLDVDAFSPRLNVVLVPDIDFVAPFLFRLRSEGTGTDMGMDMDVDNVTFILNTLDHLASDDRFIQIRNKRRQHRTLTRIEDRIREGRQEIQSMREEFKEESRKVSLEAKQEFEKNISLMLEKNDWHAFARAEAEAEEMGGILLLTGGRQEAFDNYKAAKKVLEDQRDAFVEREENRMKDKRDEEIKREQTKLDMDIRNEENRIKQLAVFLPPIIPLGLGLLILFLRLSRETVGVQSARLR